MLFFYYVITKTWFFSVKNNNYEIGTTEGKLQQLYTRNQFEIIYAKSPDWNSINIILKKRLDNFRILAVDGQGYNKCNCKQQYKTNKYKCICKIVGKLCTRISKYYNSLSCKNKYKLVNIHIL